MRRGQKWEKSSAGPRQLGEEEKLTCHGEGEDEQPRQPLPKKPPVKEKC